MIGRSTSKRMASLGLSYVTEYPKYSTVAHGSPKRETVENSNQKANPDMGKIRDGEDQVTHRQNGERLQEESERKEVLPDGRKKKSLVNRFFSGIKERLEHEMYSPLPAQFKHSMLRGYVLNQIDPATLVFPEFDETSYVIETEAFAQHVEKLMKTLDSDSCDINKHIPADFVNECKKLGLFGLQISKNYGGFGLDNKSTTRCYEELSRDWSMYSMLYSHNHLVAKAIQLYGTESQKAHFLPRLANGSSTGAFCLHEPGCGQDVAAIETTASRTDPNGKSITLNGTKTWVTNGVNADILIVFAKLKNPLGRELVPSTAFIVDRAKVKGIYDIDRKDTLGLRGINISGLKFDQVKIDDSCILGVEENGLEMALKTMNCSRYLFAAASAACLKRALFEVTNYCNATKRWGVMLSDSNAIKKRISKVTSSIYALESPAYYIAGWLDDDPSKDFLLEGAALAATDDVISGYVAMEAFKVFAAEYHTVLYKAKNVVHFPWDSIKDKLKRNALYHDNVKYRHFINEHVHLSLERSFDLIEDTIAKFEYIFKSAVYSTGKDVEEEHLVLERITDILTNLFVMITSMSRASRIYCIGFKNADHEMMLADSLCIELRNKTLHLLAEMIEIDEPNTVDIRRKELGELILQSRGYTPERPIMRNW